jgi:hypothetical protein
MRLYLVSSKGGTSPVVNTYLHNCDQISEQNNEIVEQTEGNAVIFLWESSWDKVIFPERRVALVSELPEENRSVILSEITTELSERNIPIYLIIEEPFKQLSDYVLLTKELDIRGYKLLDTGAKDLYKIEIVMGK